MDHKNLIPLLSAKTCRFAYVEAARRGITVQELVIQGISAILGPTDRMGKYPADRSERDEGSDHEDLIRRLLDSPQPCRKDLEVARATPSFFGSFMRNILPVVDSTLLQDLDLLRLARRLVKGPCDLVLVIGLRGYAYRLLGSAEREFQELELAAFLAGDCQSCHAHLKRRRARTHAVLGEASLALNEVDESIKLYEALQGQPHHDVFGDGLARAYLARADVRHCVGLESGDLPLLSGAVKDAAMALDLVDHIGAPSLYRMALFNLSVALYATGKREDLELANQHLTTARRLFKGCERQTTERAWLAWGTAMVRHELGKIRPARTRELLDESLTSFLYLGMPFEAAAVASDRMRVAYPNMTLISELASTASSRLEERLERLRKYEPKIWQSLADVEPLRRALGWVKDAAEQNDREVVRDTIEELREVCGPGMLMCLIRW